MDGAGNVSRICLIFFLLIWEKCSENNFPGTAFPYASTSEYGQFPGKFVSFICVKGVGMGGNRETPKFLV